MFTTKAKADKPVATATIERIAEENNFPSRQATKARPQEPRRKRRLYKTGRNRQFNIKATAETVDRYIKLADQHEVTQARLLELALDALERAGGTSPT